ncbi:uncharacterized protein LOC111700127 isoform X2 [Eurytemora carolleeae]|uniref:uncharacterized protein LOC111700127 isoform X2 n=1 Tax=Eurytemora carolleeae TaxID=1294199 RepID=UPI000C78AF9E|nr:uncharacterized protein LOC111700127 isoform X2 [Eurytemora carolleeae]|eukprot:XP_023326714.1 uncharacterized protein LOC111700127 isoform X2 [Eurytemora affinis]
MKYYILLFFAVPVLSQEPGPKDTAHQKDTFIRIEQLYENRKSVLLGDPTHLVQLLLEQDGRIVDCTARRRSSFAMGNIVEEASIAEETLTMPPGVEYLEMIVDVSWYARYCRRHVRNTMRQGEYGEIAAPAKQLYEELKDRKWLDRGVEGTNFCRTSPTKIKTSLENLGDKKELDKTCEDSITPLDYLNNTLNADLTTIFSCECTVQFKQCLESTPSLDSERILGIWEKITRCYILETRKQCFEYSPWFDTCVNGTTFDKAVVQNMQ